MDDELPKLKIESTDFMVSEVNFLALSLSESFTYQHYKLMKSGFTTFEAVQKISTFFDIHLSSIGYAGLKDEDGITTQNFSVKKLLFKDSIDQFNKNNYIDEKQFINISYSGGADFPLRTGEILGNHFRIIIRNLNASLLKAITQQQKYSFNFINYYGPQRFGLPNAIKNTHIIGEHIINNDYYAALLLLSNQPNEIGKKAKKFLLDSCKEESFFQEINPSVIAFYQSSYYSYLWNERIKQIFLTEEISYETHIHDSIEYLFNVNNLNLSGLNEYLPYIRVIYEDGKFKQQKNLRQVNVQANIFVHKHFVDIYHPQKWAADISFFLPSGVYATMALYQLIFQVLKKSDLPEIQEVSIHVTN